MSISNLLTNANPKSFDLYVNTVNEYSDCTQVWELTANQVVPNPSASAKIGPVTANWLRQYSSSTNYDAITNVNGVFTINVAGLYRIYLQSLYLLTNNNNQGLTVAFRIQKGDLSQGYSTNYKRFEMSGATFLTNDTAVLETTRQFAVGDTVSFSVEVSGNPAGNTFTILGGATSNGFPTFCSFQRIA